MQRCAVKCLNRAAPAPPQPRPSPHPALAPHPSRRSALLRRHARLSPARPARTRAPGASWTLRCAGTESGSTLGTGERPRHAFPAAAPLRVIDRFSRFAEYRGIALNPNIEGERRHAYRDATLGPAPGSRLAKRDIHWDIPSDSNGISRPSQMGYHVRVIWDIPSESNRISRLSRMG